jgi:CBS domain containing-hemolysin-like protein
MPALDPRPRLLKVPLVSLFTAISAYLVLLAVLALVSAIETAIHMARDFEQRSEAAGGGVAQKLRSIAANPFLHLHRALLLSATLNLALAALGLHLIAGPLLQLGWHPWATAALLFLTTVLVGDVLPKFLAARAPSAVLQGSLRLLEPLRPLLDPFAAWTDRATEALLLRLVPRRIKTQPPVTRNEFETLVEMREEQGLLDAAEADMLREALDIETLTVRDCMVPRVDLTLVSAEEKPERVAAALEQSAGRYVIVYGETPDMVEGVVDSLAWRLAGRPPWRMLRAEAPFVPETMPVLDLLDGPLRAGAGPVLIVDEYGGLEGLISQEEIADWLLHEAAPWLGEASEIRELGGGRYILDGGTRIDDVNRELGTEIDPGGLDTIGGLVFNHLGHVPKAGERLILEGVDLKVRRVVRARVLEVELRLPAQAAEREVVR